MRRLHIALLLTLFGGLVFAAACGGETETIVETVIVEKVIPGETRIEKVVETVVVEKVVAGETIKVIETVVVEKIVAGEKVTVVETVVVEKAVPGEKVVETVVVVQVATPTATGPERGKIEPAGQVTIALVELFPMIQEPRRDVRSTGGIGRSFSI